MYLTAGVNNTIAENLTFAEEVLSAMRRFVRDDWGDLDKEDIQANRDALVYGDRIFAAYNTTEGKVYIITESDRSITTVLFAHEY